jgi:deoxyribonuclease-4
MKFGFHLSIAKGLLGIVDQAKRTKCECGQIFSRSPRSWQGKEITPKDAQAFCRAWSEAGLYPLAVHLPYLPNLATTQSELRSKSTKSLKEDLDRAALLGAQYVVVHPGHRAQDQSMEQALEQVAKGAVWALKQQKQTNVCLLLETTAGQKGELGADFAELARMVRDIEAEAPGQKVGICFDTAHVWAAGYDLARAKGLEKTLAELDDTLGLDRIKLIHLNDSQSELGGRRDRHAGVGQGRIGSRGMARFVRHPALDHLAAVMETPKKTEADDLENMLRVRRWRSRTGRAPS